MKISVVIPVLNEAAGIGRVVEQCMSFAHEVIVVDGGSTDDTAAIAFGFGARVVKQPFRGYGLALATGFMEATGDIIATADGDGTYPISMIPFFAWKLENYNIDFISGCRFPLVKKSAMGLRNKIGNMALSILASVIFVDRFRDVLSGMWVFRRNILKVLNLYSRRWDLSQEIKIEASYRCRFVEDNICYEERVGNSKLLPWRVGLENLIYMFVHRIGLRSKIFYRYDF